MGDGATVKLQVQQFMDDWMFRMVHSSLAKTTDRYQTMSMFLDLMELNGTPMEAKERMLEAHEQTVVSWLVDSMPLDVREQFESTSHQLQLVVNSMTRFRRLLEANDPDAIVALVEETDGQRTTQQVLKQAVVHASKQVEKLLKCHSSWKNSTEARMKRLVTSAEDAEHAVECLVGIEAQIRTFGSAKNEKVKKALTTLLAHQEQARLHACFSCWYGASVKSKAEVDLIKKYEAQLADFELRLLQFKDRQIANVRNVLMKTAVAEDEYLTLSTTTMWAQAVEDSKAAKEAEKRLKQVQDRLARMQAGQAANAKKVLARMTAGTDEGLRSMAFDGWRQYVLDTQKERAEEATAAAAAAKAKEQKDTAKENAKGVMARMSASSDQGLLSMVVSNWVAITKEEKKKRDLREAQSKSTNKLFMLSRRQKDSAMGVQSRIIETEQAMVLLKTFSAWQVDVKADRLQRHYKAKMDSKRKQLTGVQHLFKTFAQQLEQGLTLDDDEEEEGSLRAPVRTYEKPLAKPAASTMPEKPLASTMPEKRKRSSKGGSYPSSQQTSVQNAQVTLPDIHNRLQKLREWPQLDQVRTVLKANPGALSQVLQQIGVQNPQMLQLIKANFEEFLDIVGVSASAGATAMSSLQGSG